MIIGYPTATHTSIKYLLHVRVREHPTRGGRKVVKKPEGQKKKKKPAVRLSPRNDIEVTPTV